MTRPPGLRAAVNAEWIKIRSSRATVVTMLLAGAFALGLGLLNTWSITSRWAAMTAAEKAAFDPAGDSFAGFQLAQLCFAVLGVLAVSTEYASKMIDTTFTATPHRMRVLAAKSLVVAAFALVLGELYAIATFAVGQLVLSRADLAVSPGAPGVFRAVTGVGLYLAVLAVVGVGLGALLRHSAGAIAAMFGLIFLIWPVARALEPRTYLPDRLLLANAADVIAQLHAPVEHVLRMPSLGQAYLVLAGYVVAATGLGLWRIRRSD
jgi:ABC-type transport system involved in multi-copper enzyme maturation permease subunit